MSSVGSAWGTIMAMARGAADENFSVSISIPIHALRKIIHIELPQHDLITLLTDLSQVSNVIRSSVGFV
jgi:hypothetical protein